MRKFFEMMKIWGLGLACHCEAAQITHALTRHCEATKSPKQSTIKFKEMSKFKKPKLQISPFCFPKNLARVDF